VYRFRGVSFSECCSLYYDKQTGSMKYVFWL